mmetsp:Transcript_6530/g.28725  ORF Transcript_6530/g.28725 Transcript_6530/m.28725 type:complete len:245 (-) Transcript_6530:1181-1915(-)
MWKPKGRYTSAKVTQSASGPGIGDSSPSQEASGCLADSSLSREMTAAPSGPRSRFCAASLASEVHSDTSSSDVPSSRYASWSPPRSGAHLSPIGTSSGLHSSTSNCCFLDKSRSAHAGCVSSSTSASGRGSQVPLATSETKASNESAARGASWSSNLCHRCGCLSMNLPPNAASTAVGEPTRPVKRCSSGGGRAPDSRILRIIGSSFMLRSHRSMCCEGRASRAFQSGESTADPPPGVGWDGDR